MTDKMTKTVEEVRRAAFEAAYLKRYFYPADRWSLVPEKYRTQHAEIAWCAFNDALDAVEIQLPGLIGLDQPFTGTPISEIRAHNHYNQALDDCRAAIEQTGLGLKVLP